MVAEMAGFCLLVLPLPTFIRRKFISLIRHSNLIQSLSLSLKFTFFFILILFVDSVNRVYRVQLELNAAAESSVVTAVNDRSEIQARRFYAQRNMYLCGFTLFLSLILNRTYTLVGELTALKEKLGAGSSTTTPATSEKSAFSNEKEYVDEIARLKKLVAKKDLEIEAIKAQAEGLSKEYVNVSDQLNAKSGVAPSNKKVD